jgi:hypothetical protein
MFIKTFLFFVILATNFLYTSFLAVEDHLCSLLDEIKE